MTAAPRRPPEVPGLPVIGVIPQLARDPIGFMVSLPQMGPLVRARVGPKEMYFVNEPDLVGEVCVTRPEEFTKGGEYTKRLEPMVGQGLPHIDGPVWKRARRMMNPMFSRRRLESVSDTMVAAIAEQLDGWAPHADSGEPIDLSFELGLMTMNVLCSTVFGESIQPAAREQIGRDFVCSNSWISWRIWTPGWPEWGPLPYRRKGEAALARTEATLLDMIRERRSNPGQGDMLSLLVEARFEDDGSGFSEKEIRDHAMNLLFAGYETTAVTSAWTLALLEQHPAWEERVVAEVDEVLGGKPPRFEDWPKLKVTKAAWEEAMRLYPPAFINGRVAVRDCELGGYAIPAGAMVMLNVIGAHHHPGFWDDPERYDPGRFLDERAASRHRWAFFPFGVGPHTCIASNMGTIEAVFGLAMLFQRYRLALMAGTDVKPKVRMSVQFADGPRMRVERRPDRSDAAGRPMEAS